MDTNITLSAPSGSASASRVVASANAIPAARFASMRLWHLRLTRSALCATAFALGKTLPSKPAPANSSIAPAPAHISAHKPSSDIRHTADSRDVA